MAIENGDLEAQNTTFDAQQIKEAIAEEEIAQPKVNVESDYERSKQYSVPQENRDASEVSPSIGSSIKSDNEDDSSIAGSPDNFLSMAQEFKPDAKS